MTGWVRRSRLNQVGVAALAAVVAACVLAPAAASAGSRYALARTLRWVAFSSPRDGVGLFQAERYPLSGNGSVHCVLYTRASTDGGVSFGVAGQTLAHTDCQTGAAYEAIVFAGAHTLLAYGSRLAISHNDGASWEPVRLAGAVVDLAASGHEVWALITRCRAYAPRCAVSLIRSVDDGQRWRAADPQPPADTVPGLDVRVAQTGDDQLLALAPGGGLVLAWPALRAHSSVIYPTTVAVQSLAAGAANWVSTSVACTAAPFQTELAIAPDGARLLACASEPSAGEQLKALAVSPGAGAAWRIASRACVDFGSCRGGMPSSGYLGGLYALSARTIFYTGDRSSLAGTFDGGRRWRVWPQIGGDAAGSLQVSFINARDGWALAQGVQALGSSSLWRTSDGGERWRRA